VADPAEGGLDCGGWVGPHRRDDGLELRGKVST
jgi:hypothetical protein